MEHNSPIMLSRSAIGICLLFAFFIFFNIEWLYAESDAFFQRSPEKSHISFDNEWTSTREDAINLALDQAEKKRTNRTNIKLKSKLSALAHSSAQAVSGPMGKTPWTPQMRPGFMSTSGSSTGYVDYMLPVWQSKDQVCFFNPKISVTHGDTCEQNIGAGFRQLCGDESVILGCNVYYDNRHESSSERFEQVGAGVEALSKWVDGRVNYYCPTTKPQQIGLTDSFSFSETALVHNAIYSEALRGFDYEAGIMLPWISDIFETRVYGGGFSYRSKKFDDFNGLRLRGEIMPTPFLTLELKTDFDKEAGSNTTFGVFVTLPFDFGKLLTMKNPFAGWKDMLGVGKGPRPLRDRMTDRVVRDIDIVRRTGMAVGSKVAGIIFVNNANSTGHENGTLTHPYSSLTSAFSDPRYGTGMRIYVKDGDGTPTGYTGNYVMAANTMLWGSGTNGGYKGISATAQNPVIDGGGAGNVITLSDNDTVMGVTVQNGTRGIYGKDITNATIINNTVIHNTQEGIALDLGASTIGKYIIDSNTASYNHGWGGIFVLASGTSEVDVDTNGNDSSWNADTGTPTYPLNGLVPDADMAHSGRGIALYVMDNARVATSISDNVITNEEWSGISVRTFDNAQVARADILRNQLQSIVFHAIYGIASDFSVMQTTISENILTAGGNRPFSSVTLGAVDSSAISGSITNNRLDEPNYGMILDGGGATFSVAVAGNVISNDFCGILVASTPTVDLGGGALGSPGYNTFRNNSLNVWNLSAAHVFANYNWWGTAPPSALMFRGDVDYSRWLDSDPNL